MTSKQALREAQKRWGKSGAITERPDGSKAVGKIVSAGIRFFDVKGEGLTWAAAFEQVDTKKRRAELYNAAQGQPCPLCSRTMGAYGGASRGPRGAYTPWICFDVDDNGRETRCVCSRCKYRCPPRLSDKRFTIAFAAIGELTRGIAFAADGRALRARELILRAEARGEAL